MGVSLRALDLGREGGRCEFEGSGLEESMWCMRILGPGSWE